MIQQVSKIDPGPACLNTHALRIRKRKPTYPKRNKQHRASEEQPETAWESLADAYKNIALTEGGMLSPFHPMYGYS